MPSQKNIQALADLKKRLSGAKAMLFANYHGLSVADMVKLREKIAEATGEFTIAKNTLLKLALREVWKVRQVSKVSSGDEKSPSDTSDTPDTFDTFLKGPTAILIAREEELEPLKALVTFSEGNEDIPVVKAAILFNPSAASREGGEDRILTAEEVIKLARLPGRLELQAKVVGLLASPTRGLVTVLSGNVRNFVQVIKAMHEIKSEAPSIKS